MKKQKFTSDDQVLDFFMGLPEEGTLEFSTEIIRFVATVEAGMMDRLKKLFGKYKNDQLAFPLFYGWNKLLIRYECYSDFIRAMAKYGSSFSDKKLYRILQSTYYLHQEEPDSNLMAIECAWEAVQQLNEHRGVHAHFVECVLLAMEKNIQLPEQYIANARESVNRAIRMDPTYAKYYFFKGRLLAQEGKYELAKKEINKAIDLEKSGNTDYSVKLTNYKYFLMYVENLAITQTFKTQVMELERTSRENFNDLQEQLNSDRVKHIETLAFFAAIISLIIGFVTISANMPFKSAASLLLILAGVLVWSFSIFRLFILSKLNLFVTSTCVISGILMIVGGFLVRQWIH